MLTYVSVIFGTVYSWLNADIRSASARRWFDEARRACEINPSVRVNHASSFFPPETPLIFPAFSCDCHAGGDRFFPAGFSEPSVDPDCYRKKNTLINPMNRVPVIMHETMNLQINEAERDPSEIAGNLGRIWPDPIKIRFVPRARIETTEGTCLTTLRRYRLSVTMGRLDEGRKENITRDDFGKSETCEGSPASPD